MSFLADNLNRVWQGDVLDYLGRLDADSVQCAITSPPYFGLRCYGCEGQIGLESSLEEYLDKLVAVFAEVRQKLRPDGTCFANIGDSYAGSWGDSGHRPERSGKNGTQREKSTEWFKREGHPQTNKPPTASVPGLKPKDLCLVPFRLALMLQADGWWVRSVIIWCLSGGTWVYARTQKGDMPMMVRDLARLESSTVKLWNGEKWTRLLGMAKSVRQGNELEFVLRSGERISCTPNHKFPTQQGVLESSEIMIGDVLQRCRLPEPETVKDSLIGEDAAWFAGLYIAEGSRSGNCINMAGHAKEKERWSRIQKVARMYGGSATCMVNGNEMTIRVWGKILNAIIDELVTGRIAGDKGFSPVVWRYSNGFIAAMVQGYLDGDGHKDPKNNRWCLSFTRNYNLERDLRTACARLGYQFILKLSTVPYKGKDVATFRGELRMERSGHGNERDMGEVVEIRKSRCRNVYDLGVEDDPHLFSLASGVLTHNSKPSPMPESVTSRPTTSHEYVFLLTKSADYYYDADAIREPHDSKPHAPGNRTPIIGDMSHGKNYMGLEDSQKTWAYNPNGRNARSVWTIAPEPSDYDFCDACGTLFTGGQRKHIIVERDEEGRVISRACPRCQAKDGWVAHFAAFPEKLVSTCLLAGTSEKGACSKCGKPVERMVEKGELVADDGGPVGKLINPTKRDSSLSGWSSPGARVETVRPNHHWEKRFVGWAATCTCKAPVVPCMVLDPFLGSGTTALVAERLGRSWLGCDLSPAYTRLATARLERARGQLKLMEVMT